MPNTLYLMIGVPASGKTHWRTHYLGKHTLISPDAVIDEKWGRRHWSPARAGSAWATCYQELGRAICNEMFKPEDGMYVWDATNPTPRDRSSILNFVKGAGWRVVAVYVDTPVELCVERDAARGSESIGERLVRSYHMRVTPPSEDEGFDDIIYLKHGEW